jgi:hypothetical protein
VLLACQLGQGLGVVDALAERVVPLEVVGDRRQLTGDLRARSASSQRSGRDASVSSWG